MYRILSDSWVTPGFNSSFIRLQLMLKLSGVVQPIECGGQTLHFLWSYVYHQPIASSQFTERLRGWQPWALTHLLCIPTAAGEKDLLSQVSVEKQILVLALEHTSFWGPLLLLINTVQPTVDPAHWSSFSPHVFSLTF